MNLKIITPEKIILEKEVLSMTVPTGTGELTILPGHANLLTTLSLGNITYHETNKTNDEFVTIESGFLITDGKEIKILADIAMYSHEIEEKTVIEIKARAEDLMKNATMDRNIEKLIVESHVANLHLISKKKKKI